jgi:hypothetical protein
VSELFEKILLWVLSRQRRPVLVARSKDAGKTV